MKAVSSIFLVGCCSGMKRGTQINFADGVKRDTQINFADGMKRDTQKCPNVPNVPFSKSF